MNLGLNNKKKLDYHCVLIKLNSELRIFVKYFA